VKVTRKASIEEVEDEDNVKAKSKETLPANGRYTLMTESEYREDLTYSGKGENGTAKAETTPTFEEKLQKSKPKMNRRGGYDNSNECEPTSSEMRIEHFVTNEDEERVALEDDPPKVDYKLRDLYDRPIPPPETYHAYDPRLPRELNELLGMMRITKWQVLDTERYREPSPEEVSEATRIPKPKRNLNKGKRRPSPQFRLPLVDDSMASLDALRRKHELLRRRPPDLDPPKSLTKGKEKATMYTEEDIPTLTQQWCDSYQDILQGTPEELPPLREVNHKINLINPDHRYTYHLPRCPEAYREEFYMKLDRYTRAGWWEPRTASQAAPLVCVAKKNGKLRTVVDARQRNDNTVKDVTPLPDQELIREDIARAHYRSKIDLADAYEQVWVRPEDVHKTAFATITGTYVSNVVQQGDCNAPATFQRLMTSVFRNAIGRYLHVYLDDIFVYTDSIEEHERCLKFVFDRLRQNHLYLKWDKCNLYAKTMDCLGHTIDERGIHPDTDKLGRIRDWRTPRNYNDVQQFISLVNYVANFLPNISMYTAPLQGMTQNGAPFLWKPMHQRCFDMIKQVCCKTPIVRPIDTRLEDPIWVICDASKTGIGAMYGQGPTWATCRPAGFMSKKFTSAQQHYAVHELETLAILEALTKWEDKLLGRKIHIITDHKALEFFKTQSRLSNRQFRWIDYMSRFDFDITYVKGEYNKVADCLSRY